MSDYCNVLWRQSATDKWASTVAWKQKRQCRKERLTTKKYSTYEHLFCPYCNRLCGSRMTSMAVWRPINNPFEQQEDNHTTVCDRNHRNYLPQTPLSNSSASPSISLSPHCSLNRPSGISKTNNIPVPCRSNKLVSEYLPDMPPLRIRSQRYVAASNSRAKS